jgi:hypothetical protein
MCEAEGTDGTTYYMSRGRRDSVLVSREHAWADVKAWQKNPKIARIWVTRGGEVVWSWKSDVAR